MASDFVPARDALRQVMVENSEGFRHTQDLKGDLLVEGAEPDEKGKRFWFGAVQLKKSYVSYHLMPVYIDPSLLDDIPDELRARMQGKSCFNFKVVDEALFTELGRLTAACSAAHRS